MHYVNTACIFPNYTFPDYTKLSNNLSMFFEKINEMVTQSLHNICSAHTCCSITTCSGSSSSSFLSSKKFFLIFLCQFVQKLSVTCYVNRIVCIWTVESISYFERLFKLFLSKCSLSVHLSGCCLQLNNQ